jgi:MFS family permease
VVAGHQDEEYELEEPMGSSITAEDFEDAELEGDRPFRAGTARAALSYSGFRRVFAGSIASNVGTWMQNVVLLAYANSLGGPSLTGLIGLAQLGPLLAVSAIGGSFADRFDRKTILIIISIQQAIFTFALAWMVRDPDISHGLLLALVLCIGIGQAFAAPTFSSVLPSLVEPRDLAGAVSLTSANMNLSRMVGSVIGAFIYAQYGVAWVFAINAISYFFVIAGVATVAIPKPPPLKPGEVTGLRRVFSGFEIASRDPIMTKVLVTLVLFSFFSLVFVVQLPTVTQNFGMDSKSTAYGALYFCFAAGAAVGSLSVGTFFAGRDLGRLVRVGLLGFTAMLVAFALYRVPAPAFPTVFVLGFFYFVVITSLSTVLQTRLDNSNRGRVMALWIMGFGGTVPIGAYVFGLVAAASSITLVMLIGAAVSFALVFYARLDEPAAVSAPS